MMNRLPLSTEDFSLFQRLLIETSGLYFPIDRSQPLHLALWERIQRRGYESYREYYQFLKFHPEGRFELRELLDLITIGETYFFRNKAQFEVLLRYVLPEIVQRKRNIPCPSLRVWSAGCSGGDEAYSIAIAILESGLLEEGWEISILGTDINRNALKRAKEGVYKERNISQLPRDYLDKYFDLQGTTYRLKDRVKAMVQFEYHNLVSDPYIHDGMREIGILFCRNVIIYFESQTTQRVMEHFYNCLSPMGYLFLGHTETLWQISDKFERVEFPQAFIYQKRFISLQKDIPIPFMAVPEPASLSFTSASDPKARWMSSEGHLHPNPQPSGLMERLELTFPMGLSSDADVKEKAKEEREVTIEAPASDTPNDQNENEVNAYFKQAILLANQAKYREALDLLHRVIEMDSLHKEAYYLLGVLYCKDKAYREAEIQFRKFIYLDQDSILGFYHLGQIYLFQRRWAKAQQAFETAIRIFEKRPEGETFLLGEDFTPELLLRACRRNLDEISKRGHFYE